MLNKAAVGLLLIGTTTYVIGIGTGDVFIYILCFYMLFLSLLFGFSVMTATLFWKWLPVTIKDRYGINKVRSNTTILLSVPLFFVATRAINKNFTTNEAGFIPLLANIGTLVFTLFIAWSLIKRSRWKVIITGSMVFGLFIASLSFSDSITSNHATINSDKSLKALDSLGYVKWVSVDQDIEKSGVTKHNSQVAFTGLNLYHSRSLQEAYLIDMQGNIVHKWAKNINEHNQLWQHIELCENGDLLVAAKDYALARLDWHSQVLQITKMRAHHDVDVDKDKKIYCLGREDALVFWHCIPVPIVSDYVAVLSADGRIERKVYLYKLLKERIPLQRILKIYSWLLKRKTIKKLLNRKANWDYICEHSEAFDIMHTNSIEVINRDIEGFCNKGNWLISIREVDLVAVLDPEKEIFVWSWGPGELSRQHQPSLLDNGNILIFDNGFSNEFSRVVELKPSTGEIVWEYKASPAHEFFSRKRGGCQRLPNGNTLITESSRGHSFEITKDHKIVWEFYNPDIIKEDRKRAAIYRMTRTDGLEVLKRKHNLE